LDGIGGPSLPELRGTVSALTSVIQIGMVATTDLDSIN
jgi:hypothetical protein